MNDSSAIDGVAEGSDLSSPSRDAPPTSLRGWLAGCSGALVAIVVVAIYWIVVSRDPLPTVALDVLEAARDRWHQAGPASYELRIAVSGDEQAVYRVVVRDRQVVEAERNDRPVPERTWNVWSVLGLFEIQSTDLRRQASDPRGPANLVLRGRYDETTGLPRVYERIELQSTAQVRWEVVEFTPLP